MGQSVFKPQSLAFQKQLFKDIPRCVVTRLYPYIKLIQYSYKVMGLDEVYIGLL